ncbi:GIY-YIG nuclease family protein [Paraburkholderia fungorum]|uniref:GIY-YIG nuclease family protein n=1 Tax=Paraburkholderia fungorum TaxID=134537 RepID=UPI003877B090
MQRETKIYVLRDPRTNEIRYVGKTVRDLRKRLREHVASAPRKITYRDNWIFTLLDEGLHPIIEEIDRTIGDWEALEAKWIAHHKSLGAKLTNLTDGGYGVPGLDPAVRARGQARDRVTKSNPDWRAKQALAIKASMTPERRKQISDAQKIISASEECKEWLRRGRERFLADPERRSKRIESLKASFTPERRAEISERMKRILTPELIAQTSEAKRRAWTPEMRAAAAERIRANRPPSPWTEERRKAQSEKIRARNLARGAKNRALKNEESPVSSAAVI